MGLGIFSYFQRSNFLDGRAAILRINAQMAAF